MVQQPSQSGRQQRRQQSRQEARQGNAGQPFLHEQAVEATRHFQMLRAGTETAPPADETEEERHERLRQQEIGQGRRPWLPNYDRNIREGIINFQNIVRSMNLVRRPGQPKLALVEIPTTPDEHPAFYLSFKLSDTQTVPVMPIVITGGDE